MVSNFMNGTFDHASYYHSGPFFVLLINSEFTKLPHFARMCNAMHTSSSENDPTLIVNNYTTTVYRLLKLHIQYEYYSLHLYYHVY